MGRMGEEGVSCRGCSEYPEPAGRGACAAPGPRGPGWTQHGGRGAGHPGGGVPDGLSVELESFGYTFLWINMFSLLPRRQGESPADLLGGILERAFL